MRFDVHYVSDEQLWKMEKAATAAGYVKISDCHWVQIFTNGENDIVTTREDVGDVLGDPVRRFNAIVNPEPVTEPVRVSISPGNRKMGFIPSVSLPPVVTCASGCACARKCYAAKLCRIYPTVKAAYQRNYELLNSNWNQYWQQVRDAVSTSKYFRFHVSGDIVSADYFAEMVAAALVYRDCNILAFTKKYDIVNRYIDAWGPLPENLKIIFSEWPDMEMNNKYDLPVAHVIFKGETPADDWKICGGNCSECACRGVGCWTLNGGDHIAFYEH